MVSEDDWYSCYTFVFDHSQIVLIMFEKNQNFEEHVISFWWCTEILIK